MMPKDKTMQEVLKEQVEQAQKDANANFKTELNQKRAAARQAEYEKLLKGRVYKEPGGQEINLWDKVKSDAEKALSAEQNSYHNFISAMTGLISMYSYLNMAIYQSRKEWIDTTVGNLITDNALLPLYDDVVSPGVEKVKRMLTGDPAVDLPSLVYLVDVNDKDELNIATLERSDGVNLDGLLDSTFKMGVEMFLLEKGYTPSPENSKKYINEDENLLTAENFKDMKAELKEFLGGRYGLDFRPGSP